MSSERHQTSLLESTGPTVEAYVDGSCLRNGEPDAIGAVGCVIQADSEEDSLEIHGQVKVEEQMTNQLAEYLAVISALDRIDKEYSTDVNVRVYSDSELVVRQLRGSYKVRSGSLLDIHQETQDLFEEFRSSHIERRSEFDASEIRRADELAKEAVRGDSA